MDRPIRPKEEPLVFFGTPEFAVPSLKALAREGYRVAAVVTNPDKPAGRKRKLLPSPVKKTAAALEIPILQPPSLRDPEIIEKLERIDPALFVVVAYGKIMPPEILSLPKKGAINLHPSLLPRWRGASPIQAAILNGDSETGVTIMRMDEKMDHGPIVMQKTLTIEPRENEPKLQERLASVGAQLLLKAVRLSLEDRTNPTPQNEAEATYSKILTRDDGRLSWDNPAEALERQVRAYARWPGSYALWRIGDNSLRLKIEEAEVVAGKGSLPYGSVWSDKNAPLAVETANGALAIRRLTPEGKASVTAAEFVRGNKNIIGSQLL
jgi:methionyl-tRNA formyltransferase